MYLVFRWDLSPAMVAVAASHAGLGTYLTYESDPVMQNWQKYSFKKVLCKSLNYNHWEFIKTLGEHRVFTESKLDNIEVCLGFKVKDVYNSVLSELPLWP